MSDTNGSPKQIIAQSDSNIALLPPGGELKITLQINKRLQALIKPSESIIESYNVPRNWEQIELTLSQFATFIAAGGTWRPAIKTGGNKKKDITHIGTVALDFDVADSLPEFHELNAYAAIRHTSLSHSVEQPWKQRLIFVLDRPVDVETYEKICKTLLSQYPKADQSCWDAGRFFFGSNQPCLSVCNVTLPVDFLLSTFPLPETKKAPKRPVGRPKKETQEDTQNTSRKSSKGSKKSEDKTPCELIYDLIYTRILDADAAQLYCLYPHEFKERDDLDDGHNFVRKLVGSNPFSSTNSSGTSFAVAEREGELPIWYDKSGNAGENRYSGTVGGSFLQYWYQLHPDFFQSENKEQRFAPFPVLVSIFNHFGVRLPAQFKYEHLKQMLRNDLQYRLRFNRMGNAIEYNGKELTEGILSWASRELGVSCYAESPLYQCVESVARENAYHPFLDAVESIATVIEPDMDLWENLPYYLTGHKKTDPNYKLYNVFLQKFFCGIYSRVKFPGIKYDVVLIFQGAQGTGKSTWYRNAVLGRRFFSDSASLANDKDSIMIEQRAVLHELPEVKAHFVRDIGHIRHAITQSEAQVRLPYSRSPITVKRQSLFCGTANEKEILKDPEGNRRFQIIKIFNDLRPDKKLFKKVWSTVHSLLAGYDESNTDDLEDFLELPYEYRKQSEENNKEFETTDVIEETISALLHRQFAGRDFQLTELLAILYPGNAAVNRGEQQRVTAILRKLGYDKKQKRTETGRAYFWCQQATLNLDAIEPLEVTELTNKADNVETPQEPVNNVPEPVEQPALPPASTQEIIIPDMVLIPELEEIRDTVPINETQPLEIVATQPPIDSDSSPTAALDLIFDEIDENGNEVTTISSDFVPRKPGRKNKNE